MGKGLHPKEHTYDCGYHLDQYWHECTCGAVKMPSGKTPKQSWVEAGANLLENGDKR